MPKIKKTYFQEIEDSLRANVLYHMNLNGISKKQAAYAMGISLACFYKRLQNPRDFTYGELAALGRLCHAQIDHLPMERRVGS